MTTRRTFECDICQSAIPDESKGRGFSFRNSGIEWDNLARVEHHLCGTCIPMLIKALKAPGIQEDYGR